MNDAIKMLFVDNPEIDEAVKEFYSQDPEYLKIKQEFYETAHAMKRIVGYDLYDQFEQRFAIYVARSCELYYLFGLGLRQEVLAAFL